MRLAVVADVHLGCFAQYAGAVEDGLNARARLTLATLGAAVRAAREEGARLVVAGDLFQTKRPEPAVIAGAQRVLAGADALLLLGNHDAIGPGDTALAPLVPVARPITVPEVIDGVLYVPWSPEPALARLDAALAAAPEIRVVVLHCGLFDKNSSEFLKGTGAIGAKEIVALGREHGVRLFLAGDYHRHAVFGSGEVQAVQVGALNPTGFSDAGLEGYGSLLLVDVASATWTRREIPGPRFLAYTGAVDEVEITAARRAGHTVFVRIRCAPGAETEAQGEAERLRVAGVACDVEPEEAVASLSGPARLADFDEVLSEYIAGMVLPSGVTAEAVLEAARRYVA